MIQDVAKIDGINTFIGKLKMNDNYSVWTGLKSYNLATS
jgi:hypothetical protein